MNEHKETIYQALSQMRGDDLERAKRAFWGMSEKQMQEQHGQSGKARSQIVAEYESHNRKVELAEAWVRNL